VTEQGQPTQRKTLHRELSIVNDSKNLSKVREAVSAVLAETEFTRNTCNKIIVAVDEALANVVEHAYEGGEGMVDIAFDLSEETLRVQIRDKGVRFNPGDRLTTEIDIHEHIRQGLKGGLGLFLMRQIMDEVQFNHDGPEFVNQLVMVKKLPHVTAVEEESKQEGGPAGPPEKTD
jgi:serine/threonine-protein kinase RsbW